MATTGRQRPNALSVDFAAHVETISMVRNSPTSVCSLALSTTTIGTGAQASPLSSSNCSGSTKARLSDVGYGSVSSSLSATEDCCTDIELGTINHSRGRASWARSSFAASTLGACSIFSPRALSQGLDDLLDYNSELGASASSDTSAGHGLLGSLGSDASTVSTSQVAIEALQRRNNDSVGKAIKMGTSCKNSHTAWLTKSSGKKTLDPLPRRRSCPDLAELALSEPIVTMRDLRRHRAASAEGLRPTSGGALRAGCRDDAGIPNRRKQLLGIDSAQARVASSDSARPVSAARQQRCASARGRSLSSIHLESESASSKAPAVSSSLRKNHSTGAIQRRRSCSDVDPAVALHGLSANRPRAASCELHKAPAKKGSSSRTSSALRRAKDAKSEALQLEALEVLVTSLTSQAAQSKADDLRGICQQLLQGVIAPDGAVAFEKEAIIAAVDTSLFEATSGLTAQVKEAIKHREVVALTTTRIVAVVRSLVHDSGMSYEEVLQQVVWKSRNLVPLNTLRTDLRAVFDNVNWAFRAPLGRHVEQLFKDITPAETKRMKLREWMRIVRYMEMNPAFKHVLRPTDVDRLFYLKLRKGGSVQIDIDLADFKHLLVEIAEAMMVPPTTVIISVAAHASSASEKPREAWSDERSAAKAGCASGKSLTALPK
eukprot:TRINITY_DN9015_c0_g2_i4.p1 TRINITY_DN9015_c0_g2~~TRINITY_DN9015_c0_g2_i4.p1  ORF type:complete len:676 (+),score=95.71 TRINITY_DN9015_c0_g2_i4:50-2029(+)